MTLSVILITVNQGTHPGCNYLAAEYCNKCGWLRPADDARLDPRGTVEPEVWVSYATPGGTYEEVAAVTSDEAQAAVDRLWGKERIRWWGFYGPTGDYT